MKKSLPNATLPPLGLIGGLYTFGLLLLGSLAYSSQVLDRTLLPRFVIANAVIVLLSGLLFYRRNSWRWPVFGIFPAALLIFLFWQIQSVFWADTFAESLFECQRIFLGTSVFWLCLILLENIPDFEKQVLRGAVGLAAISLFVALYQVLQIQEINKLSLYNVRGISGHRNLYGAFLLIQLAFAGMAWHHLEGIWKKGAALVALFSLLLLFLLQARSAWMALLVAGVFYTGLQFRFSSQKWQTKQWLQWALIPLTALLLALAWYAWQGALAQLIERLDITQYGQSETAIERIRLWAKTLCTFEKHPLMGVGAGNWQTHFTDCNVDGLYSIEMHDVTYQRPHNDFLWILAESGIIGFCSYLFFIGGVFYLGIKVLRKKAAKQPEVSFLRLSLLVALLVVAFFSFPKERIELLIWTYTLLALIYWEARSLVTAVGDAKKISSILLAFFMLGGLLSLYTGAKRIAGEHYMNQAYLLKSASNWPGLLETCDWAQSAFYSIDPNAIPIDWYRGTGHFSQGNFELAKADFENALQIAPFSQHCWNDLGSCYEKLGQRPKARASYLEALRISPLFDNPRLNLGVINYKDQNYQKALDWLNSMRNTERAQPYKEVVQKAMQGDLKKN